MPSAEFVNQPEAARWAAEGKSATWMSQEFERQHNKVVPAEIFQAFIETLPPPHVNAVDKLIPWEVRQDDFWELALAMLRVESWRRSGHRPVRGRDLERLEAWKAQLAQRDLVVDYDDGGFRYVPRRPGIDTDLIREPGDG